MYEIFNGDVTVIGVCSRATVGQHANHGGVLRDCGKMADKVDLL